MKEPSDRHADLCESAAPNSRLNAGHPPALSDGGIAAVPRVQVEALTTELDNLPDCRRHRINQLREAIQNGTFQVSPARIAEVILGEALGSRRGKW